MFSHREQFPHTEHREKSCDQLDVEVVVVIVVVEVVVGVVVVLVVMVLVKVVDWEDGGGIVGKRE